MAQPSKRMKRSGCSLSPPVAVLDDEYYSDIELVDAYIASVSSKSQIGRLLQDLKNVFPMPSQLSHLKRVKGNDVIIALVEGTSKTECLDVIREKLTYLEPTMCSAKVPLGPLKTKKQHSKANSYWPCNFHPVKTIEQMLAYEYFTNDDVVRQYNHMELAIKCAKEKMSAVGAVIVDPKKNSVIAIGFDDRTSNPAHHAVITALDEVARMQCQSSSSPTKPEQQIEVCGNDELPYLCTGYDIYVTQEPCLMCAMAMVHCRIRRVFYGCSSRNGALGSKTKLHVQKQLNHHYLVFSGILSKQCELLSEAKVGGS